MEDNMPALNVATGRKDTELSKSIDIKWQAVQDYQLRRIIDVKYINTEAQIADALTKVPERKEIVDQLLGILPGCSGRHQGVCNADESLGCRHKQSANGHHHYGLVAKSCGHDSRYQIKG